MNCIIKKTGELTWVIQEIKARSERVAEKYKLKIIELWKSEGFEICWSVGIMVNHFDGTREKKGNYYIEGIFLNLKPEQLQRIRASKRLVES